MNVSDEIGIATLAATALGAVASWLSAWHAQPTQRSRRVVLSMMILVVGGMAAGVMMIFSAVSAASATQDPPRMQSTPPSVHTETRAAVPPVTTSSAVSVDTARSIPSVTETTATDANTAQPTETTLEPGMARDSSPASPAEVIKKSWDQALAFSNAKDWWRAAEAWRDFIRNYSRRDPDADHAAYYNLGVAYESLHRWGDAAEAFESANRADQGRSDVRSYLRLGRCYAKLGRWNDSATAYKEVLHIDPSNKTAQQCLFWALKQQPAND